MVGGRRAAPNRLDYSSQAYWEQRFSCAAASTATQPKAEAGHDGISDDLASALKCSSLDSGHFEWLGDGEVLLERFTEMMAARMSTAVSSVPEQSQALDSRIILHIGSGSSDLGCRLRKQWERNVWPAERIWICIWDRVRRLQCHRSAI